VSPKWSTWGSDQGTEFILAVELVRRFQLFTRDINRLRKNAVILLVVFIFCKFLLPVFIVHIFLGFFMAEIIGTIMHCRKKMKKLNNVNTG